MQRPYVIEISGCSQRGWILDSLWHLSIISHIAEWLRLPQSSSMGRVTEAFTPTKTSHYRPFTPRVEPPGRLESPSPILPHSRRVVSASPKLARRLDASIDPPGHGLVSHVSLLPRHVKDVKGQDPSAKACQVEYLIAKPEPVGPVLVQSFALETQRRPTIS